MQIRKYNIGGFVYTPYMPSQQAQSVSAGQASSSSGEKQVEKAIIDVLKEQGLPNDVDKFLYVANNLLAQDAWGGDSIDMGNLIKLHSYANKIKHNNELFTKANEHLMEENAGSDVAITNNGKLYAFTDNGKLTTITPSEYYESEDKYQLMTNSDLKYLRAQDGSLTYNTSILHDLNNVVGMESIMKYLQDTIKNFGTNEESISSDRFTAKEKDQIERGFEMLLSGAAPEGIYKVSTSKSKSDQGYYDEKSMELAINYLYDTLSANMKNTLRANTAVRGEDPDDVKNIKRFLAVTLNQHTSHETSSETKLDYDQAASNNAGLGAVAQREAAVKMSYLEMVATGEVTNPIELDLRSSTGKSNLRFLAQPYPLLDYSNETIGMMSLNNMLQKAQIGQIVDKNSITFGNRRMSSSELDQVLYDDSSQLHRAWLPYDEDVYRNKGIYQPDLSAIEKFDKFNKWLRSGNYSQARINQKISELGLNISYDPNSNQYVFNNAKAFFIVTGATSHRAVNISDSWKGNVSDGDAGKFYDYLEDHTSYSEDWWRHYWGDNDSVYKSAVFMPIMDAAMATVGTGGQYVNRDNYMNIAQRNQALQQQDMMRTNF